MCPCYRVTRDERDVTRGRANTLRLALSGQLGPDALTSDEMAETLKLCVVVQGLQARVPDGVDMAKMKIEVTAARVARHGLPLADRLVAHLPRYAPLAPRARRGSLAPARPAAGCCAALSERMIGFAAGRRSALPPRLVPPAVPRARAMAPAAGVVILFADTFNRWFEPENLRAAVTVLAASGCPGFARAPAQARPLCCGRTYLAAGLVDEARAEMRRAWWPRCAPHSTPGAPVVGLEPSCLLHLPRRGPAPAPGLEPSEDRRRTRHAASRNGWSRRERRSPPAVRAPPAAPSSTATATRRRSTRSWAPWRRCCGASRSWTVEPIESSCCGMAGAFGYQAETARRLARHGRAVAAAGGARGRSRGLDRRRRHLLPPPDRGRRRARRAVHVARVLRPLAWRGLPEERHEPHRRRARRCTRSWPSGCAR